MSEFQPASPSIPTTITCLTVTLRKELIYNGDQPAFDKTVRYHVVIQDQEGKSITFPHDRGDLLPILTADQIFALNDFIELLWARAEQEFLPPK